MCTAKKRKLNSSRGSLQTSKLKSIEKGSCSKTSIPKPTTVSESVTYSKKK